MEISIDVVIEVSAVSAVIAANSPLICVVPLFNVSAPALVIPSISNYASCNGRYPFAPFSYRNPIVLEGCK